MEKVSLAIPFPDYENLSLDLKSAGIISPSYAGLHSELSAILQYFYHSLNLRRCGLNEVADILEGISVTEMEHLKILGIMLYQLGVDPVLTCNPPFKYGYFTTAGIMYSKTPQKMLMDDISGEMVAICEYQNMLDRLDNEQVSAVISRIKLDEELHVKVLKEQLEQLKC